MQFNGQDHALCGHGGRIAVEYPLTSAQTSPPARPLALAVPYRRTGDLIAALAPALAGGRHAYCLDGGNLFNPLDLAAQLRRDGIPPGLILAERLFVSRAFTCHQLAGSLRVLLGPLALRDKPPLVLILGVEGLFMDEDIPLFERRHLFERILADASILRARGLPLLLTCGTDADNPWLALLKTQTHLVEDPAGAVAAMRRIADGPHPADL